MEKLIKSIDKMRPAFEKISNNPYLRAIRDGFISCIPVILFSSIFILVACVPNIFNYFWSDNVNNMLWKAYNYSMGILAMLMVATIAKSLSDNFNTKLPKLRQINPVSVMIVSIISFLLISTDSIEGGFANAYMGTKGLLTAFVVAFIVPNIYKVCVKNNVTIKMPDEVPHNISQTFADLIPLALSVLFFWLFDIGFRNFIGMSFSAWILEVFKPLFSAADGYLGLALIFGAMAMFWFVGIHGPSIVEPAVTAIYIANVDANLKLFQSGQHASFALTHGTSYFVATLGGTGATLMFTAMCAFMAKSKQLKAVGRTSIVPVLFAVNEPILFGAPVVLNPILFVPFICTPILNVWIFKFFIDNLGMNGFIYTLPWTTPGTLGLILGTGFAKLSFILAPLLLLVDFVMYYPFFKVYDKELIIQEAERVGEEIDEITTEAVEEAAIAETPVKEEIKIENKNNTNKELAVLVLCASGATSSMLANAITKGAKQNGVNLESIAMAYGQHKEKITDFDLIVLAPQMASMYEELKNDCDAKGTKSATTSGREYVKLTRDPEAALKFALDLINK
ncbi:PTS lactose transporter subunit IIBC [Clostridium saccharobutylicum]|uniref:PTS system lactose-specific EIICB component n=2 Tax=Clostridium saccharobutylicum TaxID=169679 RepID=U5MWA3_CLOSA|nr:PTS lactose transporter subunit IIBC [Clostridium saccharobutylicum]AGX45069.1 PTS system lactose-specific EIICB component LacE [Clostridium saccharobutylicum DSM 13864]AQR92351.1 PTS system lactose-specific EIICB component [Clostridium saccharobutylicum]AQS02254.1 PTS system lactose-specific EIICB component [Clostridium saccharobutylicum]AQS11857.1 PTS system lactose-specific EIICB component [Clostridium saccharobutylicum]AQS16237.1 PTS system lactose-specific EIICB component [Clostridium 